MKAPTCLLVMAAGLAILLVSCCAAEAATAAEIEGEAEAGLETREVGFFISGLLELLLRPLKQLVLTQINSIINSIKDQGGLIIGNVKKMVDSLLEIIRPFIIRILDQINNIIGVGVELKERLRMAVEELFKFIGVINEANKAIIKSLIMYIVEKLLPSAAELDVLQAVMQSPFMLAKIKQHLIAPILEFARIQLQSIVRSIMDQAGLIGAELLKHSEVFAEIIRPHVIRILDITGNLHGEAIHLREAVKQAVESILGGIGSIGAESVDILARLIEMVTDSLVSKISGNAFLMAASQSEAFLIVDKIIGWIVQPILNKINGILDQVRKLVEDKTEEAKAKLLRLYDELTLLLKDPVVKIIGVLSDIGIEIGDVAKAIKRSLEMLIDGVSGIHQANKAMFKAILSHIISGLLKLIDRKEAAVVFDFSMLAEIVGRIIGPIVFTINGILTKLGEELAKLGNAANTLIHDAVEKLARLLTPLIVKIIDFFVKIGIGSVDAIENVSIILKLIATQVSGIAEANKQLLNRIIEDLNRRIIELIRAYRPRPKV